MKAPLLAVLLLASLAAAAQDSVATLGEVVVRGFESRRAIIQTPASVSYLSAADLRRFSPASLVPVLNTVPGVRMEERSPGSYRLSLRGSLLRSPFGVRNVKVYWKDIPFTDASGNTYINLLDISSIGNIEILKGPGASIYGANTGGVILLGDPAVPSSDPKNTYRLSLQGGSFDQYGGTAQWNHRTDKLQSSLLYSHRQAKGYREQSELRRDIGQWTGTWKYRSENTLDWVLFYSDLFYETPGGLTAAQAAADPKQARPAAGALPGAVTQQAAIYNKTFFGGLSHQLPLGAGWSNTTSLAFSHTDFRNPFITNYEKRLENNWSARTRFAWQKDWGAQRIAFNGGLEWQYGSSDIDNFDNERGEPGAVQQLDAIWVSQFFPFMQGEWQAGKFTLQAGSSVTASQYAFKRLTDASPKRNRRRFDAALMPRFAALYALTRGLSVYATVSRGFSPPTLAEVRPSTGQIYTGLEAERGWNYEAGWKGSLLNGRVIFDMNVYRFELRQAIVSRRDSAGAEFFVNAGGTRQDGWETMLEYRFIYREDRFVRQLKLRTSYTLNNYYFEDYIIGNENYSGNRVTGVPQRIWVTGIDIVTRPGLYANINFNYTSKLPLDDANGAYAPDYRLLQGRLGWRILRGDRELELYGGIDNLLDERYSLGNDINARGARYFNPAPPMNYFAGIIVKF